MADQQKAVHPVLARARLDFAPRPEESATSSAPVDDESIPVHESLRPERAAGGAEPLADPDNVFIGGETCAAELELQRHRLDPSRPPPVQIDQEEQPEIVAQPGIDRVVADQTSGSSRRRLGGRLLGGRLGGLAKHDAANEGLTILAREPRLCRPVGIGNRQSREQVCRQLGRRQRLPGRGLPLAGRLRRGRGLGRQDLRDCLGGRGLGQVRRGGRLASCLDSREILLDGKPLGDEVVELVADAVGKDRVVECPLASVSL